MLRRLARFARPTSAGGVVAVLVVALSARAARAAGASPDSATAEQTAQAQGFYTDGVAAFKAGRFADAAKLFSRSYEVVASPNSHIMYARALREAGDTDAAYEEFALVQAEAAEAAQRLPKYASTAQSAESEMLDLSRRVAALSLDVTGDSSQVTLFVGKREVPRERWRAIAVTAGNVDVTARLPGGRRIWQAVDARLGSVTRVKLDVLSEAMQTASSPAPLPPPRRTPVTKSEVPGVDEPPGDAPSERHPLRPYAYLAGGVGALGLVTFAVAGAMSRSTYSDLEAACPGGVCPPDVADRIDTGRTEQTVANVGLIVGLLGAGAGVTLLVLDHQGSAETASRLRLTAGPAAVTVRGRF